jgi:hypothetical protein
MAQVDQIEPVLIPCVETRRGMFDNERLVTVRDSSSGDMLPMFASCAALVKRNKRQYIRATRMSIDEEAGISVCLLPVAVTETPSMTRWVRVPNSEIVKP